MWEKIIFKGGGGHPIFLEILTQPMGKLFRGFVESETSGVVPRPNMAAGNGRIRKLLETRIVGALRIDLGLLSIRVLCFFEI